MKSKGIAGIIALLAGSAGLHKFYLGQNRRGWTLLFLFFILFPALTWSVQHFFVMEYWRGALILWLLAAAVLQIVEGIRIFSMSQEKFAQQDASRGSTAAMTITVFVLALLLVYGSAKLLSRPAIDITVVNAEISMPSEDFSRAFREDENAFNKKYLHKVIQLQGEVTETGEDFEKGPYFALKGAEGDAFGIKCFFIRENAGDAKEVEDGDIVTMKGVCDGNILQNCKVISVQKKEKGPHTDSI